VRVIVIGGTGTIGAAVVQALEGAHEVVVASRGGEPHVDLADPASIAQLLERSDDVGAVVCCAASAPLTRLSDERFIASIYVAAVEGGMSGEILRPGA
jgi:nucleoside-diphosphate-sugar epimerase